MLSPHLPLYFLYLTIFLPSLFAQKFFYPDGSVHVNGVPCSGKGSHCCTLGEVCESNFLCDKGVEQRDYNDEVFVRHSCSDETYKSGLCPGVCLDVNPSGDTAILACDDGSYCCQPSHLSPSCCIANPLSEKFVLDGNPTAEMTIGSSTSGADVTTVSLTTVAGAPVSSDVTVTVYGASTSTLSWQSTTKCQAPTTTQKTTQTETQVVTMTMMAPVTNAAGSSRTPWLIWMVSWALLEIWEGLLPVWLLLFLSIF